MDLRSGFTSLFTNQQNKAKGEQDAPKEGIAFELEDELTLKMDDKQLVAKATQWRQEFDNYKTKINYTARTKKLKEYWKGKQYGQGTRRDIKDNLIFENLELLLPIMTRRNPEPTCYMADGLEERDIADNIRDMIVYQTDRLSLRLKVKQNARNWSLGLIGCVKVAWDMIEDDITVKVVNPKRLILDPDGYIDSGRFYGRYIGELKTIDAETAKERFPNAAQYIDQLVKTKTGTQITYTEWWTPEYVFYTLDKKVLYKSKNPHWNYQDEVEKVDQYGNTFSTSVKKNHFMTPQMPYTFLSVFSLQEQPHDETTLIEQVLGLQDTLNKRMRQIDKNIDGMNNSVVFGGGISKEEATEAKAALDNGDAIHFDIDDIRRAFMRDSAPPLPAQVYNTVEDYRNEMRNIMGTRGSSPQGIMNEQTLGGKIAIRGQDVDRVSLIVDHIEQQVDYMFNWFVQMFYVYYTEAKVASIVGNNGAVQYSKISNKDLFDRKVTVSVKEGSLIPKDTLTLANQAIDLYGAGAMDLISLYEALDYPNPEESAKRAFKHINMPQELYAEEEPLVQGQQPVQEQPPNPLEGII